MGGRQGRIYNMIITNSDLKALLSLHNFLPQYKEEQKFIDPEYIKAITRYEKILIKLLEQKIQENEDTRNYLIERRKHG